jgi:outer membrane receptor for ferrienterochelin and colicins
MLGAMACARATLLALALLAARGALAAVGPPAPPGTAEGDFVELDGEVWQVHDGHLYTLDDPALSDPRHTVTVTGSRVDDKKQKVVRAEAISAADIAETGARTLGEVLEEQAGIQVNSSLGLGQEVQLDGLDGRHVLVLIDGRPVNGRVNNRVDVSRIPVSAGSIERIEIVRGPMSALYGSEALGGVINIVTKRPSTAPGAELELGGQVVPGRVWTAAGLHGRGGAGPVALRLDLNVSDLPGLDRDGDGKNDLPDRRQLGVHAEAALALFHDVSFRAQLDGSSAQSVARTSGVAPFSDRARNDEWSLAALVQADVLDDAELSLDMRLSRFRHLFDKLPAGGGARPPSFCSDGGLPLLDPACPAPPDLRTHALLDETRLELRYTDPLLRGAPFAEELTASAGAVLSRQRARRENGDGEDTLPGGGERDVLSLYSEVMWRPFRWLALVPGGRADIVTPGANGKSDGEPRSGLDVDTALGPKIAARIDGPVGTALRASYGRGFRLPSFEERLLRFDHSELGYIVDGNPELRPERSHGMRAEVMWEPIGEVSVGVETYLNLLEDLITEAASGDDRDGIPIFTYRNATRAWTSGVTTRLGLGPFAGLRFDVAYQYLFNAVDASRCPRENPFFCRAEEGATSLPLRAAHSLDANLRYRLAATGTTFFVRADALSERPVDADTTAPGSLILATGVRQPIFKAAELVVGLENLLDSYHPIFGPKPGRHASVSLRVWQ